MKIAISLSSIFILIIILYVIRNRNLRLTQGKLSALGLGEQNGKEEENGKEEKKGKEKEKPDFLKKLSNHLYWFPSSCWIIFLAAWWLTRPILFKHYIWTLPSLGFHLLFLVALPILIGVESQRYGKIILSFITVALLLFIATTVLSIFTPEGQTICDQLEARITAVENEKKAEKVEETIRNVQREKLFAELEKLEDGKDTKSLSRIKEIKTELANLTPQPKQPEKRGRIVREGVFKIPANKLVETVSVTQIDVDKGVSCILIQQGEPQVYWFKNGSGDDIKITNQYDCIHANKWGILELKGGKKATTVKIQIVYTNKDKTCYIESL